MSAPDVVYLCRSGENEELRYSLRSLKNVPHGQVWIFGGAPSWISDRVNFVGVPQTDFNFRDAWKTKFENTRRNLYTATQHPEVSEHFLLMNDDFYVTEVIEEVPVLHYGTEEDFCKWFSARQAVPTAYVLAEMATLEWCRQMAVAEPKSYALHVPLPVEKRAMAAVLEVAPASLGKENYPLHMRTAYGNLAGIGGTKSSDVKVERGTKTGVRRMNGVRISGPVAPTKTLPKPFASSSDRSFKALDVGRWVRAMFTEPSAYELA